MEFPSRSTDFTGTDLAAIIHDLSGHAREEFILQQVKNGCVPEFMRTPVRVALAGAGLHAVLEVQPDHLCLGTDEDFIYAQCTIGTAQQIADLIGASLPTKKIVDAIYVQADCKLLFVGQGPPYDQTMASSDRCIRYSANVLGRRTPSSRLFAGHFKDYVLNPGLDHVPPPTAIYGGRTSMGRAVQDENVRHHERGYMDYSQCPRFVATSLEVGDDVHTLAELLGSRTLYPVVAGSPSKVFRVPGV